MPDQVSTVVIAQPDHAPGRFALLRAELPDLDHWFVWCGRSLGWLPLKTTSSVYVRLFSSWEEAQEAADEYITLPIQEQCPSFPNSASTSPRNWPR